jgi:hypothetical protein
VVTLSGPVGCRATGARAGGTTRRAGAIRASHQTPARARDAAGSPRAGREDTSRDSRDSRDSNERNTPIRSAGSARRSRSETDTEPPDNHARRHPDATYRKEALHRRRKRSSTYPGWTVSCRLKGRREQVQP